MKKAEVEAYTDGSCLGNPGPGGWAYVLLYGQHRKEMSGYAFDTTNQRMELLAAAEALEALKRPCRVTLYSDSAYLINAFQQGWVRRWQGADWQTKAKTDVANRDLWERIIAMTRVHDVEWAKVKGHSDNELNNRCDELARTAARKAQDLQSEDNGTHA